MSSRKSFAERMVEADDARRREATKQAEIDRIESQKRVAANQAARAIQRDRIRREEAFRGTDPREVWGKSELESVREFLKFMRDHDYRNSFELVPGGFVQDRRRSILAARSQRPVRVFLLGVAPTAPSVNVESPAALLGQQEGLYLCTDGGSEGLLRASVGAIKPETNSEVASVLGATPRYNPNAHATDLHVDANGTLIQPITGLFGYVQSGTRKSTINHGSYGGGTIAVTYRIDDRVMVPRPLEEVLFEVANTELQPLQPYPLQREVIVERRSISD